MIEGLKVTVTGSDLIVLCANRAAHLEDRAKTLKEQLPTLDSLQVPNTSNRPGDDAREKIKRHTFQAAEMRFISQHIEPEEQYRLSDHDLVKIGIGDRGW